MTLTALIKKDGLAKVATMTPATLATHETIQAVTVADVATVAVAIQPETVDEKNSQNLNFYELSVNEELKIRSWLKYIEETDPDIINDVIIKCHTNPEAREFFLLRAEEVPQTIDCDKWITCGECYHFDPIEHPNLGHCAKREPEAIAGLWDTDRRNCKAYIERPKDTVNDNTEVNKRVNKEIKLTNDFGKIRSPQWVD